MFYRGRVTAQSWLFFLTCLLLLAGCGAGGSGTSPQQGARQLHDLTLSVSLEQRDLRGRLSQGVVGPELTFASVTAELEGQRGRSYSGSTAVGPQASRADLFFSAVEADRYGLTLRGFNADGIQIAVARTTLDVGLGETTSVTLVLTAEPPHQPQPPIARNLIYRATPGELLTVPAETGVLSNDTTVGGTVSLLTPPEQGDLNLQSDGSFTYLPSPNATATDRFTYRLTDPYGSDEATVTFVFDALGRGFYVQAGSTGTGESPENPRPDLDGAVAESEAGDRISLLYSPDPLEPTLGERILDLPDQVSITGFPQGTTPREVLGQIADELPEVHFQFRAGNGNLFDSFRVVASQNEAVCFDLTERDSATFIGMEIVSPGLKIQLDDFVGVLDISQSRIGGGSPGQLMSEIPGSGDIFGTLNNGLANIIVTESELPGATFEITARGTSAVTTRIEDCDIAGNLRFVAQNGGRNDLSLLDGRYVRVAGLPGYFGTLLLEHAGGGFGDLTVSRMTSDIANSIEVRSFDQLPGVGGRITVECLEYQSNYRLLDARFEGGEYEVLALSNSVQEVDVINSSHIYIQGFQDAAIRALIRDNVLPLGFNSPNSGSAIELGLYDNVFGLADANSAGPGGNPGNIPTEEIREILVFLATLAVNDSQGTRVQFRGNRVGPVGALGDIRASRPGTAAYLEVFDRDNVEADNTIEDFNRFGNVADTTVPLLLPDDPGDCSSGP